MYVIDYKDKQMDRQITDRK